MQDSSPPESYGAGDTAAAEAIRGRLDEYRSQLRQIALDKGQALRRR